MPGVSPRLQAALSDRRSQINSWFRVNGRGVEPDDLFAFLRRTVDPLLEVVPQAEAASLAETLVMLGTLALRRGLVGGSAASTPLEDALRTGLPAFATHLSEHPRTLISALGNGFLLLDRELGEARAAAWLGALTTHADACDDLDTLFRAGLVSSWIAGLAEAREAALEAATLLPEPLRTQLLGTPSPDPSDARRFAPPRSTAALQSPTLIGRTGGFVGFGGAFSRPPKVVSDGVDLYVHDGRVARQLFADVFGLRLVRCGRSIADLTAAEAPPQLSVSGSGTVRWADDRVDRPDLGDPSSCAAASGVAAVTLYSSFGVFVLGRPA